MLTPEEIQRFSIIEIKIENLLKTKPDSMKNTIFSDMVWLAELVRREQLNQEREKKNETPERRSDGIHPTQGQG